MRVFPGKVIAALRWAGLGWSEHSYVENKRGSIVGLPVYLNT